MSYARCQSCGGPMVWALVDGSRMPLDPAALEPREGLVAFNEASGGGRVVTGRMLALVDKWTASGVTYHSSHFATCSSAARHRGVSRSQEALF